MSGRTSEARVTARVVRTAAGETHTEYEVGGVTYGSLAELREVLNRR